MLEEKDLNAFAELMDQKLAQQKEEIMRGVGVLMENDVAPKFNLLSDGQSAILDKLDSLAALSRVEALEDDVALLKQAIRSLSQELAELKRAQ